MEKIEFWKEKSSRVVDPYLFSRKADAFAKQVFDEGGERKNKPSQLRKFFDEVSRLNMRAKTKTNDWKTLLPLVHMITAKSAYATGRNLITLSFHNFIKQSVDQVETPDDLDIFALFFESFIGFYKAYRPKD